jgi:hypothetical protein
MVGVHLAGEQPQMAGIREQSKEPSGYKKCGYFLYYLTKYLASQAWLSSLSFVGITITEYTYYYISNNDTPAVPVLGTPRTECSPHVTLNSNTVTTSTTSHNAETKKQPP